MQLLVGKVGAGQGTAGWQLNQGTGDRVFDVVVPFQAPFAVTPAVQVSLATIDADAAPNLRVEVLAVNVTPLQFTLRMHTWSDTKLYVVHASWLAFTP